MTACHGIIAAATLTLCLYAEPRDAKGTFDLLKKGAGLSAEEAERIEKRVTKKPDDAEARIQLLSYYASPRPGADLALVKAARARHILWLIGHDPKNGLGLFKVSTGVYRLHCQGDDLAEPETFKLAEQAWLEQLRANPESAEIRQAAVDSIQYCSPEQAERILIEGKDERGLGHLYAAAVLGITGQSYLNNDLAGSDAAFRARPFAVKARRILEETTGKDLVFASAVGLLWDGAKLWADGKLDWDYTPLGNALLAKAKAFAPDAVQFLTVPTTLPARGERPPLTIRVGGNVQGSKLIRQVPPVYPRSARDQGIQGTVELTALIGLDGKILHLHADSGPVELVDATLEAVRQWEYQPTQLNGRPCYVSTKIDVNYTLSSR
jgi:TonB family protein